MFAKLTLITLITAQALGGNPSTTRSRVEAQTIPANPILRSNSLPYYWLPWDSGLSITVSQGNNGTVSHFCPGIDCYAGIFPEMGSMFVSLALAQQPK